MTQFEGSLDSKVLFISDFPRINCRAEGRVLSEYLRAPLDSAVRQAGLLPQEVSFFSIHSQTPPCGRELMRVPHETREADLLRFKEFLSTHKANVLVPLGDYTLTQLTGLESISKWHLSVVPAHSQFGGRKCFPMFHPEHIQRAWADRFYLIAGCQKLFVEKEFPELRIPERRVLQPQTFMEAKALLQKLLKHPGALAVDIETGRGQINTVGFATSEREAIAIRSLPDFYTKEEFFELWQWIAKVLESSQPKILQNFIYEDAWFSRYGIRMNAVAFDTMWAMKFLHPEFEKGLDNVGRIYTPFPYWKDDNDNWNNIRDWNRHLTYNGYDCMGTYAAWENQTKALKERNLWELWSTYITKLIPPLQEMCTRGLLLDPLTLIDIQQKLTEEKQNFERLIEKDCIARGKETVNPRSPAQVKALLLGMGMKLPTQKGKVSTDKKALVKLRKKYPEAEILPALIGLSKKNKQLSSYVNFDFDRDTNRVHYAIDGCGTETGRFSAYKSGWGEGFNPQTVPKSLRKCFITEPGKKLVQIDLSQAESRFVAYESPEPKLMQMLEEGRDVHKYVASQIYKKPEEFVQKRERDLGKKSGHAANYGVGPRTFSEACLVEMDLVLSDSESKRIIDTYFSVFPGIKRRQLNIQTQVRSSRVLRNPFGRERHFYGRMDDSTFREAYAYCPQSTIPDITNHLLLKLWQERDCFDVEFLLQVHDSLLLQVPEERVFEISEFAKDLRNWHPKITLPGGDLWIPVDVEMGDRWNPMQKI